MSQPKTNRVSWAGWLISALLIVGSVLLWIERQQVVDAISYYQFKPTPAIAKVADESGMTDDARFTFYATNPVIESSESFNRHCERRAPDSPILGCYAANRIYIFDVTDERLDGIKVVTAAHELLHAEYDRLPEAERKRLEPLLQSAYERLTDDKLKARMDYYDKTQPGQQINELHSIIGTEFESVGPELEAHYARYFTDRLGLVALHRQVDDTFKGLANEANDLVARIEQLAATINTDTRAYNEETAALNQAVESFNARASQSGGFTTQADFQAARQELTRRSNRLADSRQAIQSNIVEYKTLLAKLDTINAESASLNQSLDSVLSDVPTL